MQIYDTVKSGAKAEITVERSRFIANVFHIESEEEANNCIASVKAQYHDAKHNVFAYSLYNGVSRFSDDGEPHGTAGKPIADIIAGGGIYDCLVTVTRYFGGVLLGTGGLVRAYSSAARQALDNSRKVTMQTAVNCEILCKYGDYDYLQKTVLKYGTVIKSDFTDSVKLLCAVKKDEFSEFENTLKTVFLDGVSLKYVGEDRILL